MYWIMKFEINFKGVFENILSVFLVLYESQRLLSIKAKNMQWEGNVAWMTVTDDFYTWVALRSGFWVVVIIMNDYASFCYS